MRLDTSYLNQMLSGDTIWLFLFNNPYGYLPLRPLIFNKLTLKIMQILSKQRIFWTPQSTVLVERGDMFTFFGNEYRVIGSNQDDSHKDWFLANQETSYDNSLVFRLLGTTPEKWCNDHKIPFTPGGFPFMTRKDLTIAVQYLLKECAEAEKLKKKSINPRMPETIVETTRNHEIPW